MTFTDRDEQESSARGTAPRESAQRGRSPVGAGRRERRRSPEPREHPEPDGPFYHVAFRGGRREVFVNPKKIELKARGAVLVEAERGRDLGWIALCDGEQLRRRKGQPVRAILGVATDEDVSRLAVLAEEDLEALEICRSRAAHFKLDMKIIDAETQFDGNRVTFYFTAERRVDFRELVRDLASIFRTRIELRQVGARDAARRCDGIGPCGRQLCCTTHLLEFEPVTLKMAKEQSLSLNPAKISGACGRLMCCLTYECQAYQKAQRAAPAVGSRWHFESRDVEVRSHDIGNNRVILDAGEGEFFPVDLDVLATRGRPLQKLPAQPTGDDD